MVFMIIYKITNNINGKIYIGLSKKSIKEKIAYYRCTYKAKSKNRHIFNAMKKHGFNNFKIEQIDSAHSFEELCEKEKYWIKYYDSIRCGYNILQGGQFNSGDYLVTLSKSEKKKYCENMSKSTQGKTSNNKKYSTFVGVRFLLHIKKWSAHLKVTGNKYIGYFSTEKDAAIGYDKMVFYFYKEGGTFNFPELISNYVSEDWKAFWLMINDRKRHHKQRKIDDERGWKKCNICCKELSLNNFYLQNGNYNGKCKSCKSIGDFNRKHKDIQSYRKKQAEYMRKRRLLKKSQYQSHISKEVFSRQPEQFVKIFIDKTKVDNSIDSPLTNVNSSLSINLDL
jgi:hypothetical protein